MKTPRDKLMRRAERYWSNPDVRLAKANYKRRQRGLPERQSVDQIESSADTAARRARDAAGKFQGAR